MLGFHRLVAAAVALVSVSAAPPPTDRLPRYESLRVDLVNMRVGPGEQYPIEWVYRRKGLPVEVTAQFDVWRRVRDSDGTEGWVHERMLSQDRSVLVTGAERTLRHDPGDGAAAVAEIDPGVVARLLDCKSAWCHLEVGGIKGWLPRDELWGLLPNEVVE